MPYYKFRIMTFEHRKIARPSELCRDDADAIVIAKRLLTKDHIVDIWQGFRKV